MRPDAKRSGVAVAAGLAAAIACTVAFAATVTQRYAGRDGPGRLSTVSFQVAGGEVRDFTFVSRCPGLADGTPVPGAMKIAGRLKSARAKRLLVAARAAGYEGSDRSLRRAVAEAKTASRRRRQFRPWLPAVGGYLVVDWAEERPFSLFCAVLPWSRSRFVRFAADRRRETVLALLAECFEEAGGVPAVVLSDRMAGLRATTVANVVVPHPDYVRFALRYGFRPDFCETHDPQSKGVVEHLVGYAQADLLVPQGPFVTLAGGNAAAV